MLDDVLFFTTTVILSSQYFITYKLDPKIKINTPFII